MVTLTDDSGITINGLGNNLQRLQGVTTGILQRLFLAVEVGTAVVIENDYDIITLLDGTVTAHEPLGHLIGCTVEGSLLLVCDTAIDGFILHRQQHTLTVRRETADNRIGAKLTGHHPVRIGTIDDSEHLTAIMVIAFVDRHKGMALCHGQQLLTDSGKLTAGEGIDNLGAMLEVTVIIAVVAVMESITLLMFQDNGIVTGIAQSNTDTDNLHAMTDIDGVLQENIGVQHTAMLGDQLTDAKNSGIDTGILLVGGLQGVISLVFLQYITQVTDLMIHQTGQGKGIVTVTETEAVVSTEDIPGIHIINADRETLVKGKRPWQLDTTVIRKNG